MGAVKKYLLIYPMLGDLSLAIQSLPHTFFQLDAAFNSSV